MKNLMGRQNKTKNVTICCYNDVVLFNTFHIAYLVFHLDLCSISSSDHLIKLLDDVFFHPAWCFHVDHSVVQSVFLSVCTTVTRKYSGGEVELCCCRLSMSLGGALDVARCSPFLPPTGRSESRLSHRAELLELVWTRFLVRGHSSG